MISKRSAVNAHYNNGHSNSYIVKSLKSNKMFVSRTIARFNETRSIRDRPRTGGKRTVRTPTLRKNVKPRIRRNPVRSIRKLAREMNTGRESMRLLVRKELGMCPYKYQKRQLLSIQNKAKRFQRSRSMHARFTNGLHNQIVYSDEKLFTVEHHVNKQKDRILAMDKVSPFQFISYLADTITNFCDGLGRSDLRWTDSTSIYPPRSENKPNGLS